MAMPDLLRFLLAASCCLSLFGEQPVLVPTSSPGNQPYPPLARICRVEGEVPLRVFLDSVGRPTKVEAEGGPRVLRGSAEAYVRQMRFLACDAAQGLPYVFPFRLPKLESASPLPAIEDLDIQVQAPAGIDAVALQEQVRGAMVAAGLPGGRAANADAWHVLRLDLEVGAFSMPEDAQGYLMRLRCSRKVDKGLDPEADPREGRAWAGGRAGAFRGRRLTSADLAGPLGDLLKDLEGAPDAVTQMKRVKDGMILIGDRGRRGMQAINQFQDLKVRKEAFTPYFPSKAFARGWSGSVDLELRLDAQGVPVEARMTWGDPVFQEAAVRNAMALAFQVERPRTVTLTMFFGPGTWEVSRGPSGR